MGKQLAVYRVLIVLMYNQVIIEQLYKQRESMAEAPQFNRDINTGEATPTLTELALGLLGLLEHENLSAAALVYVAIKIKISEGVTVTPEEQALILQAYADAEEVQTAQMMANLNWGIEGYVKAVEDARAVAHLTGGTQSAPTVSRRHGFG